jgi:23S rRNA pseudouridine1911/1915/1917 synthase
MPIPAMQQRKKRRVPPFSKSPASHFPAGRIQFLYEDSDLIVIEKPAGLPVIAPEGSRAKTLYDIVTAHMQKTNPRGRAAVVHRLDRDTSGVMLFAKNARTKKALMDNWNKLVRRRCYTALVEGTMPAECGTLDSWLIENRTGQVYETKPGTRGALRAITHWKTIAASEGTAYSLLELELETGRKHQIRAQLAAIGHPVAGDARYGAHTDPAGRLCLHAHLLEFEHPFTHKVLMFESPVPKVFYQSENPGLNGRL